MEHIVNQIILTGNLAGAPRYSHENHGRRFFRFFLLVKRDGLPFICDIPMLRNLYPIAINFLKYHDVFAC